MTAIEGASGHIQKARTEPPWRPVQARGIVPQMLIGLTGDIPETRLGLKVSDLVSRSMD